MKRLFPFLLSALFAACVSTQEIDNAPPTPEQSLFIVSLPNSLTVKYNETEFFALTKDMTFSRENYDMYEDILIEGSKHSIIYLYQLDTENINQQAFLFDVIIPALENAYENQPAHVELRLGRHEEHPMLSKNYSSGKLHSFRDKQHLEGEEYLIKAPERELSASEKETHLHSLEKIFREIDPRLQIQKQDMRSFCKSHNQYH